MAQQAFYTIQSTLSGKLPLSGKLTGITTGSTVSSLNVKNFPGSTLKIKISINNNPSPNNILKILSAIVLTADTDSVIEDGVVCEWHRVIYNHSIKLGNAGYDCVPTVDDLGCYLRFVAIIPGQNKRGVAQIGPIHPSFFGEYFIEDVERQIASKVSIFSVRILSNNSVSDGVLHITQTAVIIKNKGRQQYISNDTNTHTHTHTHTHTPQDMSMPIDKFTPRLIISDSGSCVTFISARTMSSKGEVVETKIKIKMKPSEVDLLVACVRYYQGNNLYDNTIDSIVHSNLIEHWQSACAAAAHKDAELHRMDKQMEEIISNTHADYSKIIEGYETKIVSLEKQVSTRASTVESTVSLGHTHTHTHTHSNRN
eukprot:GHVR01004307.1.p1 GENE.GHVR01004307.1~~GHVR01004307.1.p1  ORF type:complete len:369 (-),score=129.08 GHVR01004307.1:239-1345(-)